MLVEETREVFLYETSCLINNIEDDVVLMMLGTCPRLLPKRQLLKYAMSQAATFQSARPTIVACGVPLESCRLGYCTFGKLPPWDIAHLGSCQGEELLHDTGSFPVYKVDK